MNPLQRNKVDLALLSEEEQKALRLYGKLPTRKDLLQNKLKERKYFDSGDYALSKAGKASSAGVTEVGSQHPSPETIPHPTPTPSTSTPGGMSVPPVGAPLTGTSGSPVKESSFLHKETSIDDVDSGEDREGKLAQEQASAPAAVKSPLSADGSVSPPIVKAGIPIRWQSNPSQ